MEKASLLILEKYKHRRTKNQKMKFINHLSDIFYDNGYPFFEERRGIFGDHINVLIGDIKSAKTVVCARYSERPTLFVPNLIAPKNKFIVYLYRFFIFLIMQVISLMAEDAFFNITKNIFISFASFIVVMLILAAIICFGPSFAKNADDNTSGVISIIETAKTFTPEQLKHSSLAFVLLDDGCFGFNGAKHLCKLHKKNIDEKVIINIDSIGSGEHIFYICNDNLQDDTVQTDKIIESIENHNKKINTVCQRQNIAFHSDGDIFEKSMTISSFSRGLSGIICSMRRHTIADTKIDEINISLIKNFIIKLVRK